MSSRDTTIRTTAMDGAWRETSRRLSDGTTIRTAPCGVDGWIHVTIFGVTGNPTYVGTVPVDEAFAEIPFQLDRARQFERLLGEANEAKIAR